MRVVFPMSLCLLLVLPGCAQVAAAAGASELAALMIGTHQTSEDDANNDFADTRIPLPALGPGHWVYYQLNTGDDRAVYRQRVLQLTDKPNGGVLQTNWSLKSPESYQVEPSATFLPNKVSMDDLVPALEDGCDQHWRYEDGIEGGPWVGLVDPETCEIYSERQQSKIAIKAEARLSDTTLYQTEKGFDASGTQLFGDPEGEFIILYRQI